MKNISIVDTTLANVSEYGLCGYKNSKKEGFPQKFEWLKKQFPKGLRIKTIHSQQGGTQGMIEYIPGKYCWRPVEAPEYMFIHCIFVGFKKVYKQQGWASLLLRECEKDTKNEKLKGIAVVTRKGSFMAGKELFVKNGFTVADSAKPDFELLVKKFQANAPDPAFKIKPTKHTEGLTIIRADQCPYSVKNVREIVEAAENEYGIQAHVVNLKSHKDAQKSPCAFGTFCIMYDGQIVAEHPISKGRFVNIMNKIMG